MLQEEVRQAVTPAEPVQYYFTLAQQPAAVQVQGQQQGQQTTTSTTTIQPGQIIIAQPQQGQVSVGIARGCAVCQGPLAHPHVMHCSVLFSLLPAVCSAIGMGFLLQHKELVKMLNCVDPLSKVEISF